GRRKTSIERVRLEPGDGQIIVNDKDIEEYFNYETLRTIAREPLVITDTINKFNAIVNVEGGGFTGQAGAIRHGVARALLEYDKDLRPTLKKEGHLTRDPRMKERVKYGFKKARERQQFSKRL